MQAELLDSISELTKALTKELQREGLIGVLADAAKQFVDEIEEVREGDLLKLTDHDREIRAKEMEKYPIHATVFKNGKPIGFASNPKPYRLEGACSDGLPLGGCCGPGEACSSSTCTGTPLETLPEVDSTEAYFGFGLDACDIDYSGTKSSTVFPSVGLYELISKLTPSQKDGLIESLGEGRWVKLDTLKRAISKIENPGPRFNTDPLRAE
jgi:hypothetical protein